MILKVKIMNGHRQGDIINIEVASGHNKSNAFFLEDEALEISFVSDFYLDKVSLILHENELEYNSVECQSDSWVYKWIPKRLGKYAFECFFHNYFGLAELVVETTHNEKNNLIYFDAVEVFAKKINADRVDKMLGYLSQVDSDALCSFFRVTRRKAGFSHGDMPAEIILERIESITSNVSILVKKIIQSPITKLTTRETYVLPTDSNNFDDLTLAWLCNNVDELFETDTIDMAVLEYNHSLYGANKILENRAFADTDVYENQVVHGFISSLILSTGALLGGFELKDDRKEIPSNTPDGYVSFFSQIKKFQKGINRRKIDKCYVILDKLHALKKTMSERIPTKKIKTGIPIFTMKAKKDPLYLSAFKIVVDWYRYGKPDWSVQQELLSIQSIPRLFEYYSLFYIKDLLDKRFISNSSTGLYGEEVKYKYLSRNGIELELHYEPKYWMVNHPNADMRALVNSEAWTVYNGSVTARSSDRKYSNRSPDFVISIGDGGLVHRYIILDAKYTTSEKSFTHYLPDLTMKYLHGLNTISNSKDAVTSLMLINPDECPHVKDFHHNSFGVFSDTPAIPFMVCAAIAPGDEYSGNHEFEGYLNKIIDQNVLRLPNDKPFSYKLEKVRA